MTLEALAVHTKDQELRIKTAIGNNRFTEFVEPKNDPSWATFRNEVWGNRAAILESQKLVDTDAPMNMGGAQQGDDSMDLDEDAEAEGDGKTDKPAAFMEVPRCLPKVWSMGSTRIFVRSEFEQAEQAALRANEIDRNLLVCGQVGIGQPPFADSASSSVLDPNPQSGKSFFLIWLLVRRLAFRLPTVFQVEPDEAILFHEGGTSTFTNLNRAVSYGSLGSENPHSRIWVLVDTSPDLPKPSPAFCKGYPFFIVEAGSRPNGFQWAKKVRSEYFYMKTWSLSEVLQAYASLSVAVDDAHEFRSRSCMGLQDESTVRNLFNTYGLPPRELIDYAERPGDIPMDIVSQFQQTRSGPMTNLFQFLDSDAYDSHLIMHLEPTASRTSYVKTIASPFAFQKLWNEHLCCQLADSAYFYDMFCDGGPATADSAGWMFEFWMHQLLAGGYNMALYPIARAATAADSDFDAYGNYTDTKNRSNKKMSVLPKLRVETLREEMVLEFGRYYRPEAGKFPTIDSLVLVRSACHSPTLFMFRITRNRVRHKVDESDLDKVDRLQLPEGTRKYYVAVTPPEMETRIMVPRGRFECQGVRVFHNPVPRAGMYPRSG